MWLYFQQVKLETCTGSPLNTCVPVYTLLDQTFCVRMQNCPGTVNKCRLKYIEDVDYVISCFFTVVCSESQFVKSICCKGSCLSWYLHATMQYHLYNDYFGNVLRTEVDISQSIKTCFRAYWTFKWFQYNVKQERNC